MSKNKPCEEGLPHVSKPVIKPHKSRPMIKNSVQESDGESSEEEEFVYLSFDTILDSELLQPETPFKLIGLEDDQPILQLGSQVFAGNWRDTLGTAVFLAEDPSAENGDPVFTKNPSQMLCYHSKSRKMLSMSRVFINPKQEVNLNGGVNTSDISERPIQNTLSSITVTEEQPCCSYSVPAESNDMTDGTY